MTQEQKYEQALNLANDIGNFVNSFEDRSDNFNKAMSYEHRTLQQSFTKLCLKWLEYCASDEYRFDPRNEGSQKIARELLEGFKQKQIQEGFTGETLKMMSKPSGHLGCI
jgi:hypothetical protein